MSTYRILHGDAREKLPEIETGSVQTCVTSPPYWGLRSYLKPDDPRKAWEIGTETTPEQYIEHLVEVFREVRRVLRDDGTVWLNLGSSYASGGMSPSPSPLLSRAPACDSGGKALQDSPVAGRACPGSDDGRQASTQTHRGHIAGTDQHPRPTEPQHSLTDRDTEHLDSVPASPDASIPSAPASSVHASFLRDRVACAPVTTASVSPQSRLTSSPESPASAGTSACTDGNSQMSRPLVVRTMGKESFFSACGRSDCRGVGRCGICWGNLAIPSLNLKAKDLVNIPQLVASALQADGWYLRSDIIWHKCLSGGTRVYARTQKGEMPMTVKDLVRLDPATVKLWNGEQWTQAVAWSETARPENPLEIELRAGERIGCTPNHVWPTQRGNVRADGLRPGDVVQTCRLPEPEPAHSPSGLRSTDVGWFVGLYIAEGSRSGGAIQIASHAKETERFQRLRSIAAQYDGTCAMHYSVGNRATINLHGPVLAGILDAYVSGRTAKDKHLSGRCWRRSDGFLRDVLDGYLSGDGHHDAKNFRWRLGFTCNDPWAADLRTLCARLGVSLRLKRAVHMFGDRAFPGYRGQIRFERSEHHNNAQDGEVIAIRASRARKFWDISVQDDPHLFALASGVLTHNSNPMPESVRDRPTKAHEYIFLLSKSPRYYYGADAIAEPVADTPDGGRTAVYDKRPNREYVGGADRMRCGTPSGATRNARSVWEIATAPYPGAHFATFPPALIEPCILAGTSAKGCCPACRAPWERVVECETVNMGNAAKAGTKIVGKGHVTSQVRENHDIRNGPTSFTQTTGWQPGCRCYGTPPLPNYPPAPQEKRYANPSEYELARLAHEDECVVLREARLRLLKEWEALPINPCTVLDPFGGSGTTAAVATGHGRSAIVIELQADYLPMIRERCGALLEAVG